MRNRAPRYPTRFGTSSQLGFPYFRCWNYCTTCRSLDFNFLESGLSGKQKVHQQVTFASGRHQSLQSNSHISLGPSSLEGTSLSQVAPTLNSWSQDQGRQRGLRGGDDGLHGRLLRRHGRRPGRCDGGRWRQGAQNGRDLLAKRGPEGDEQKSMEMFQKNVNTSM